MAIILLPNCTMLYYVFSGPLSLRAYVPEIKFNNNNNMELVATLEIVIKAIRYLIKCAFSGGAASALSDS